MINEIEEFNYLWEDSSPWVLLYLNPEEVLEAPRYLIANTETTEALLIHDDDLYIKIQEMMLEKDVRIIVSLPLQ
jgi:hypothetical protein